MRLFGWLRMRRINLPNDGDNGRQAKEVLKQSEQKLKDAIRTSSEVDRVRDQFARSVERAMRRSNG